MENKNEVVVLTEAQIAKLADKAVSRFETAFSKAEKSAWELAKVCYEITTADNFKSVFGTVTKFAETVKFSKGRISQMVKAYERKLYMDTLEIDTTDYKTAQIEEICYIPEEETADFMEEKEIQPTMTKAEIRKLARNYMNGEATEEAEEATEEAGEATEEAKENKNIHISFNAWVDGSNDFMVALDHTENVYITESQLAKIKKILGI